MGHIYTKNTPPVTHLEFKAVTLYFIRQPCLLLTVPSSPGVLCSFEAGACFIATDPHRGVPCYSPQVTWLKTVEPHRLTTPELEV